MLGNLEEQIGLYLDKTPLIAKWYLSNEFGVLKKSLDESHRLRSAYEPTEDWYTAYAKNLNLGINAIYNSVDRTYDLYESVQKIPFVGGAIRSWIDSYLGVLFQQSRAANPLAESSGTVSNVKFTLPQKTTSLRMIEHIGLFSSEALCSHYEVNTGKSADHLRPQVTYTPVVYGTDPSPLRLSFLRVLDSIGEFFNELSGVTAPYSRT